MPIDTLVLERQAEADVCRRPGRAGASRQRCTVPDETSRPGARAAFLALCADCLETSGSLHIATDWANYAEHIDEMLEASREFECVERREHDGDTPLDRPQTKFERRGLRQGHRIWDWRFDRVG